MARIENGIVVSRMRNSLSKMPQSPNLDINGGQEYELEDILKQIYDYKDRYDGITLSGGHHYYSQINV